MATVELELNEDAAVYFTALPSEKREKIHQYLSVYVSAWLNQHKADADGLDGVDPEEAKWWASLTPEQQAEERAIVLRSIAEGNAGRTKPAEEVYARLRAKFAHKKVDAK